jgi:hypothetical protein
MDTSDFALSIRNFYIDNRQKIKYTPTVKPIKYIQIMEKIFKKENGDVVSVVKDLSPQVIAETIFDGRPQAHAIRLYLDGENPDTCGIYRPCLRVEFSADGKTVVAVDLLNDPRKEKMHWKRR